MVKRYSRGRGKTRKKPMNSRKRMNSRKIMNSKKRRPKTRKRNTRRYKRTLMKGGAHNPHLKLVNKTDKVVKFVFVNGNYFYELNPMTYTSMTDTPDNSLINVMVDEKKIGEDFLYQADKINIVFVDLENPKPVDPKVFDPKVSDEVKKYEDCCATSVLSKKLMSGKKLTFVNAVPVQRGGDGTVDLYPEGSTEYPDDVVRRVGGTGRELRRMNEKGEWEVVDLDKTIYKTKGSTDNLTRKQLLDLFKQENVTRTQSAPVRGSVEGNNTELESTQSAPAEGTDSSGEKIYKTIEREKNYPEGPVSAQNTGLKKPVINGTEVKRRVDEIEGRVNPVPIQ